MQFLRITALNKVAHALFAIAGLMLPRRCVRDGVVDPFGVAPSVAPSLCSTAMNSRRVCRILSLRGSACRLCRRSYKCDLPCPASKIEIALAFGECHPQNNFQLARCHRITVFGRTTNSASRHSKHLARMAKLIRVAAWFGIGAMPAIITAFLAIISAKCPALPETRPTALASGLSSS
jgi:hypothetical protein